MHSKQEYVKLGGVVTLVFDQHPHRRSMRMTTAAKTNQTAMVIKHTKVENKSREHYRDVDAGPLVLWRFLNKRVSTIPLRNFRKKKFSQRKSEIISFFFSRYTMSHVFNFFLNKNETWQISNVIIYRRIKVTDSYKFGLAKPFIIILMKQIRHM